MAGRFLTGVSAGCYSVVIVIYIAEISSDEVRGALLSLFQLSINIGVAFVFIVGYFQSLLVLNVVCACIPIIYSIVFFALPESPILLTNMNREVEAREVIQRLRGDNYNFESEIQGLKKGAQDAKLTEKTFIQVFRTRSTVKAFVMMMLQFFFFQFCGINAVLFYSTTIFIESGVQLEPGVSSIIVVVMQAFATLVSVFMVDRWGRKALLSASTGMMALSLFGIATFFTLKDNGASMDYLSWLPVTSLSLFVIFFSIGVGPVTFVLLGELFAPEAKAYVAPVGQVLNMLLTFAIGLFYPYVASAIGAGITFYIFGGFSVLALLFTIFILPETKGKSMEEIQRILS